MKLAVGTWEVEVWDSEVYVHLAQRDWDGLGVGFGGFDPDIRWRRGDGQGTGSSTLRSIDRTCVGVLCLL